jgi:hypothetical protein
MKAILSSAALLALSACATTTIPQQPETHAPTVDAQASCGPRPAGRMRSHRSARLVLYRACKARENAALSAEEDSQ